MDTLICQFNFSVRCWNVVANRELSIEDWRLGEQHWVKNRDNWSIFSPKLAFLPALKRRRLSESARLFFEAAWDLMEEQPNIPVVYASANSEINRNFALWNSLLSEGDVSPTSFNLSVHNALVGQWSEMRQVKAETSAIMAQQDNLEAALLEAYFLLQEGQERVLVVVAESPLDDKYNAQPVIRQPFAYALALIVEKGTQYELSLHTSDFSLKCGDNALFWVQQQHLQQNQWETPSSRGGIWKWRKN